MKYLHSLLAILIVVYTLTPTDTHAIGLAVTPSQLNIESVPGESVEASVTVKNASDEVAYFEAFPDAFDSMIDISPRSFTLEAEEARTLTVRVENEVSGQFQTELSIVARPLGGTVYSAAGGVKIPLSLTTTHSRSGLTASALGALTTPPVALLGILLCIGVGLFLYQRRRGQKSLLSGENK